MISRRKQMDRALLEAALEGLQHRLSEINEKIANVRRMLGPGRRTATPAAQAPPAPARGRRRMSAAARKRIAEAQRRRWAAFRQKTRKGGVKKTAKQAEGAPQGE